jgi:cytochrome c556
MGRVLAAIAEVTAEKCPVMTKVGDMDPKNWKFWSRDFKDGANALAEGARKKDAEKVHAAAKSIMAACNECHAAFRDTP